jgi:hypothetical protein
LEAHQESYIEKIKNARPLEFDSVQEDLEGEDESSSGSLVPMDFENDLPPADFDFLKEQI